ncbi:MAG: hypothetical protein K2G03_01910 [Bacilli bacterium]|nr:hypothetical protein [Bacilli bacterium]MDE6141336.1 hypothetical protein [Bacilli bacterium]
MKKKMDYDTKRIIVIIAIGFIFLGAVSIIYSHNHHKETWLVCINETEKYQDYEETIKYRYVDATLYGFYREEKIMENSPEDIEERYNYFKEIQDGLELSSNLDYDIKKNDDSVEVKTYIGVSSMRSFFNSYIKSIPVSSSSSIDEVKDYYVKEGYKCEISYK